MRKRTVGVVLMVLGTLVAFGAVADAQTAVRSGWVPNVGVLGPGEYPLGDLWTFTCPAGGSGTVWVQSKDDFDTGTSGVDLVAYVVKNDGTLLGYADDNLPCTYPTVCGYACPLVSFSGCDGQKVSVVVKDFGTAELTGTHCDKGGGYVLSLDVFKSNGVQLTPAAIALGGGPSRFVPGWAKSALGIPAGSENGPALDDEDVPQPPFALGAGAAIMGGKK
jgi:hypothetical protein